MPRRRPAPERTNSLECECGNEKSYQALMCARCAFLDGRGNAEYGQARVISLLRDHNELSLAQLVAMSGASERSMHVILMGMLKTGRVRRQWRELDGGEREGTGWGKGASVKIAIGCWIYYLATPSALSQRCQTGAVALSP